MIAVWELAVRNIDRRGLPLPPPARSRRALGDNWSNGRWPLGKAAAATLFEALGGLVIGTSLGVIVALLTARWATARDVLLPLAIGASAVPIIAVAPILNNWFGVLNPLSKMMIVAAAGLLPGHRQRDARPDPGPAVRARADALLCGDGMDGPAQAARAQHAALLLHGAQGRHHAGFIGAIVGEYFGGTSDVLGRVVVQSASALRFDVSWAAILIGGDRRDRPVSCDGRHRARGHPVARVGAKPGAGREGAERRTIRQWACRQPQTALVSDVGHLYEEER